MINQKELLFVVNKWSENMSQGNIYVSVTENVWQIGTKIVFVFCLRVRGQEKKLSLSILLLNIKKNPQ